MDFLGVSHTQHGDAVVHSTSTFPPDDKTVPNIINFHGPVTIPLHHHYLESTGYLSVVVFTAFCAFGISWAIFIRFLWLELGKGQHIEQPTTKPGNRCVRQVGRTPGVASGSRLGSPDNSNGPEASRSPGSTLGTDTNTHVPRGRRLPAQDSGSSSSSTLPPYAWRIKEPGGISEKDWMPSLTSVAKHLEGSNIPVDRERKSTIGSRATGPTSSPGLRVLHHLVQAPPLSQTSTGERAPGSSNPVVSGRPKQAQVKARTRLIPYRGFSTLDVRIQGGLTPCTVQTRQVESRSSLETTLFGDPRILQPVPIVWFILVVAVNYGSSQDPYHDLEFWKRMLKDPALVSEAINFTELAGEKATPENIKETLTQLWHDSGSPGIIGRPNLFVYLTGEGDSQNRMCLLGKKFISEADINRWLRELRATSGYTQPITLVLDICRTNKDKPSVAMDPGVELICSSSPGEKALALRFKSEQDTPYSSFILAFLIASSVSPTCTSADFVTAVEQRSKQLTGLIKVAAETHGREYPGPQSPDWSQASDLSTFLELARMISRTTAMREVYDFITQLPYFREENTASNSTADYGPLPKGRTSCHYRGVNKPASAICSQHCAPMSA